MIHETNGFLQRSLSWVVWKRRVQYLLIQIGWRTREFLCWIRARAILEWHLSWTGSQFDLLAMKKDEFHKSLNMDMRVLPYLSDKDLERYRSNLIARKIRAHEIDLAQYDIAPR